MFETRKIASADIDSMVECADRFFNESRNKRFTENLPKFRALIEEAMKREQIAVLVTLDGATVVSYAILNVTDDFTNELIGDMYQFYVLPEYRGKGVSRLIAQAVVDQFDAWGCPLSHVCADTGIDDDGTTTRLFANLWGKFGYKQTGVIMTRES